MRASVVGRDGLRRRLRLRQTTTAAASANDDASPSSFNGDEDAPPSAPGALDAEWQALLSSRAAAGLGGEPASEDDGPEATMMPSSSTDSGKGPTSNNSDSNIGAGSGSAAVGHSWPSSSNSANSSASADDTYDWLDEAGYTPFPSNLPADVGGAFGKDKKDGVGNSPVSSFLTSTAFSTNLGGNSNLNSSELSWQHTSTPVATPPLPWEESPRTVYVILFGVGGAMGTEGIYALRAVVSDEEQQQQQQQQNATSSSSSSPALPSLDAEAPLPHDTIVAFEAEDDALRYASQLEAAGMDKHAPSVSAIDSAELLDFCSDAGYDARLEARNTSLLPPECSVGLTDWERSARLRKGAWSVLPSDPEFSTSSSNESSTHSSGSSTPVARSPSPSPPSTPRLRNNAGAYPAGASASSNTSNLNHLSPLASEGDAALVELRAMLERLLESSPSSSCFSPSDDIDNINPSSSSTWATDDFEGDEDIDVV